MNQEEKKCLFELFFGFGQFSFRFCLFYWRLFVFFFIFFCLFLCCLLYAMPPAAPPFYDIIASSRSSCLMDQQAWLFHRKSCRTTWRRTLPSPCGSSTNTMPARINTSKSTSCATPTITVRINKIKTWATFNRKFSFIHPFLIKLNFF